VTAPNGTAASSPELRLPPSSAADATWCLVEEGFDLAREPEIESLFAVSNGYVGTRAALAEGSPASTPATYIAGIFGGGRDDSTGVPGLLVTPDWTHLRATIDGHEVRVEGGRLLEHRRVLDFRRGLFLREWRHLDAAGRVTRVRGVRLASLADRRVLLQSVELTPENYGGCLRVEAWTGPPHQGPGASIEPAPELGSTPAGPNRAAEGEEPVVLVLRTREKGHVVALAMRTCLFAEDARSAERTAETVPGGIVERWRLEVEIGATYRLDRAVAIYTSREVERPAEKARAHLERLDCMDTTRILADHVAAWDERWRASDVEIEGDDDAQRALRFACYHLIGAADPADEHVSIGARMLTGGAYKGHVFWDTEIYMLPFYVFTHPPSARALLMYRYHTLPAAREKARTMGWPGAFYAWESADTGEETTPSSVVAPDGRVVPIRTGEQEIHVSAAVAYATWQYWQATGDDGFFRDAGAEILIETARFWAGRGELGEDGLFHVRGVIGPDEYHEDVDDSAYTNVMAQWNLERGAETARIFERRWPERWRAIADRLGLDPDEPGRWSEIARSTYTGFDPESGLFEQFRGYFDLEEVDLAEYEPRTAPMDVLLGHERIRRTQVIKQADVVLLLFLLWDRFPAEVREANFRYYEPRCGHGSSLSPSIHALVAARLGDMPLAERYFRQAVDIDLANNMGNAAGGVHAAALGGLWQSVVFGFAGLGFENTGPVPDPHLPDTWRSVRFPVLWRGRTARVQVPGNPEPGEAP
jgi:trehalose/maltose hydrolase-like predicted phosphorylase